MTQLCAAIFVESVEQAVRESAIAAEAGADLVEFRVDHLTQSDDVIAIADRSVAPCIFTCRSTREGGESDLADEQRIALLDASRRGKTRYIDIELQTLRANTNPLPDLRLIVSAHDFAGRPARLNNLVAEMNATIADVSKIAWMGRSIRDNLEAFELLQHRQRPTIALCMGEAGLISRILAKKFGAFLTYASVRKLEVTAPGQPTIDELKRIYRWDSISAKTKVFGLVGSPIAHSLSPAVHNAAFDAIGFDGVYVPMLVEPSYESFKAFMISFVDFAALDLSGLSITIPHKENALRYLKEIGAQIDPLAQQIGAVNTISIERISGGAQLRGFNTDHAALLDTITTTFNIRREDFAEKRIAVIGAGGVARTAVAALADLGATVVVYNRTREKADALANEFNGKTGRVVAARLEKLCDSCCHIFINCTPVGMPPNVDESPLGDRLPSFTPDTLVFDTIYNPAKTKLLHQAEQAGAKTVNGLPMFLRQAAAQFEAWTGQTAPVEVMRAAVERSL